MRILQVSAHYPPDFISGGALIPQRFAKAALERGHKSAVFAGRLDGLEPLAVMDTVEEGVPVRWVGNSIFLAWDDEKNYRNPGIAKHFHEFVTQWRPNIVHFHSMQTLGGDLVRIAKDSGAATIVTMHDFWWSCARQFLVSRELDPCPLVVDCGECACSRTHEWLEQRNAWLAEQLRSVDMVLAPSVSAARVYVANGVDESIIRVHENGVDVSDGQGTPTPSESVRFMYAGGEAELKGYEILKEATRLARVPQGTTLDLYNAAGVGFPDWVQGQPVYSREHVSDIFAAHDVLVLPSIMRESHSILTREALAAGLAVIATDTLGPEEAVADGVNGRIIAAGDPEGLAHAIEDLANLARCREFQGKGTMSPLVSTDEQVEALFDLYEEALALHKEKGVRKVGIENVVIVTGIQGAPGRYRAHLPVEGLATVGVQGRVVHYRDTELHELCAQADAVVMYRVPATVQILDLIDEIRATDTPILGDIDDLIFDPDIEPLLDNLDGLTKRERALWRRGVYRYRTTLEYCDYFLGSTATISEEANRLLGVPTRTWANGVGAKLAQVTERALAEPRTEGPLRIGYFSGTDTHDADWAAIEPAVARVLDARPEVELWLGGMVKPTEAMRPYERRIKRIPYVAWYDLPIYLKDLDVCLAPLTANSIFNEAKSAIKWLEAALALTPTVASPTQPFREAIEHGVTGMLASDEDEWIDAIGMLLDDEMLREGMARQAKRRVLMELSPARQGARYVQILEDARELVTHNGHRVLSSWENVVDDEPASRVDSQMESYELPRRVSGWHSTRLGHLLAKIRMSLRDEGISGASKRTVRKLKFYAEKASRAYRVRVALLKRGE